MPTPWSRAAHAGPLKKNNALDSSPSPFLKVAF
jgi:hypothetical protein